MIFSTSLRSLTDSRRLKLFFALSRTPHGVIDMAAPALAALLCLGHFPPLTVILVGLVTVFAGYTAVYALNDVIDIQMDQEKVRIGGCNDGEDYLDMDGVLIRHPMAKGALGLGAGMAWTACWALVALAGAYWLNPVCFYIFLVGCLLEGIYCLLWRVTPLRTILNGVVKTLGSLAAVYAVNPDPSAVFLLVLFLWIFTWEIGGQNIPNDWTDIEEDRYFKAQTIPVRLGTQRAGIISVTMLVCALFFHLVLLWLSPLGFGAIYLVAAVAINAVLLLWPALRMAEGQDRRQAMDLFNKASYYPLATLTLVLTCMIQS